MNTKELLTASMFALASVTLVSVAAPLSQVQTSASAPVFVPDTAAATRAAGLIHRAIGAFSSYLNALEANDGGKMSTVLTEDAVIEYPTQRTGMLLTVDGASFGAECVDEVSYEQKQRLALTRVFPTADPTTVFVEYEAVSGSPDDQQTKQTRLAMVEMDGERISRIRNFTGQCDGSGALMQAQPPLEAKNNSGFKGVRVKE